MTISRWSGAGLPYFGSESADYLAGNQIPVISSRTDDSVRVLAAQCSTGNFHRYFVFNFVNSCFSMKNGGNEFK